MKSLVDNVPFNGRWEGGKSRSVHVLWRNEITLIPTLIQCELIIQETGGEMSQLLLWPLPLMVIGSHCAAISPQLPPLSAHTIRRSHWLFK